MYAALSQRLGESPEVVALGVLVLAFVVFAVIAPNFLSFYALSNILTFASVLGIVTVGIAFLMISGEFDLSVGSTLAVAGYAFIYALLGGVPAFWAMLLALLTGALCGLINGLIVVWSGIPSFIATLGTLLAYRGIAHAASMGKSIPYQPATKPVLFDILNGYVEPINRLTDPAGNLRVCIVWFVVAVLLVTLVLTRTRYGNWTFATGGNPEGARAQGVNVRRVKLLNFVLSGFLAGLASVVLFAQRTTMYSLLGEGLELTVVAAAVIGGVSLAGGSGTIIGAALGMVLLAMVEQALVLLGVPNDVFRGVVGAIVILSVIAHTKMHRD